MRKWKTLTSEYLHKSPFVDIRKDSCELPNGIVIEDYFVNEYSDWVNAIVITKEEKIVLVEQFRYAANDFFLEVPAGRSEDNETQNEAILREIKEETGYISEKKPILLGEFYINPATQNNKVSSYLIVDAYPAFEQNLDPTEFIEVKLFDIEEISKSINSGEINHLFSVNAFNLYKAYLNNVNN